MALAPGAKLGPYEIVAALGAGGMGEVYRARDTRLDRAVAIKILPAAFSDDARSLDRFEREARILSTLNHSNLLSIYDVGAQESIHYLVSELLDGETLRHRMQDGTIPTRKALDYAVQIANGLAAAHDKGVVHRDLKPENIFVTEESHIKILDFGLAKQNVPGESEKTVTLATEPGMVLGTVGYMSPEQVRGESADSRSDIFSFGAILYEMLTGTRAFRGGSSVETLHAILKENPPQILSAEGKISPGTERLMRRCMEKASGERFQSARDLAFAIEALSGSSGTEALAIPAQEKQPFWERNWRLWCAASAGLLLAVAPTLWLRHSAPVVKFLQLTNDSYAKNNSNWPPPVFDSPLATDGARLYFTAVNLEAGLTPAQVSVKGGEIAPIHLPLPYAGFELMGISPDSSELLVESFNSSEVELHQWIVPITGGSPRRLDDLLAHDAAWSPDKRLVAFATGDGLFLLDSNNGKRKIFTASGVVLWPRWSPDGKRLRFTVEDASTASSALWELGVEGGGAHLLLPGWNKPSIECCGEWTRDGRYYVFQTGTFAHSDVWVVRDGLFGMSQPSQLTAGPLSFASPLPSLDGDWLYVVGSQRRYEMVRLDPTSGQMTAFNSMPSLEALDYSRDGKWMAYVTHPDGVLWRSRADGSDRLQLTYPPMMASSPQWSPDGRQIAFTRIRIGEPLQIEIVSADGGTSRDVFPEARNQGAATWSADGQSMIFGRLPWLESGKSLPTLLEKVDLHTHQLSEIAGSEDILAPSISPDGKYLCAVHTSGDPRVAVYDFNAARWNILSSATGYRPAWARDSGTLYLVSREGELQSYRPANRQLKSVVKIPGTFSSFGASLEAFTFLGIGLDGAPLLVRDQGSSQIYAMKWQK